MSDWKNVQYKDGKMRTSEGGGGGSSTFAGLDDVSFNNLQNGQVPKYNSTTQKWENADESGGGGTVMDVEVDGVSVVNPQGVAEINTPDADAIDYDNQQSGLSATDVQSAIDELAQGGGGGGNVDDVEVNGVSVVDAQKIAKITSYKEVTLAEYQALPSSKLSDNVLYCIKDTGGADGFPPLIYSDEEREVGVWRNGKPLYQKSIKYSKSNLASGNNVVRHGLSNIDEFTDIQSVVATGSGLSTMFTSLPRVATNTNYQIRLYDATSSQFELEIGSGVYTNLNYIIVTFRYTKTTDTAGSGTWTTQGGYAHHYSTSEKVIGTWIDGKPLYEKTFSGTMNYAVADWTSFGNVADVDKSVYIKAIVEYNNGCLEEPYVSARYYSGNVYYYCNQMGTGSGNGYIVFRYTKTTD